MKIKITRYTCGFAPYRLDWKAVHKENPHAK
jgi:hypothetical protein